MNDAAQNLTTSTEITKDKISKQIVSSFIKTLHEHDKRKTEKKYLLDSLL